MNLFAIIVNWLAKSFQFSGRATRSEYWKRFGLSLLLTMVFQGIVLIAALQYVKRTGVTLLEIEDAPIIAIAGITSVALITFLMLSTTARRFQDHGWSGRWFKWMFFLLIPALLLSAAVLLGMALGNASLTMAGLTGSFVAVFLPYASIIYTFWIGFVKPDPMTNKYGPNPSEATS